MAARRSCWHLVLFIFFIASQARFVLAGTQHFNFHHARSGRHHHPRHHGRRLRQARSTGYAVMDSYKGQDFINQFNFFNESDPTNGNVAYVSQEEAVAQNLTFVTNDGIFIMGADARTVLPVGSNRKSVRLQSKKMYGDSLIILDLYAMPHGCAVWPAFWSTSGAQQWPTGGEVDIIEGINNVPYNHMTLHTLPGCTLDTNHSSLFTGRVLSEDCNALENGNAGCGVADPDPMSYGHPFNMNGGAVFATLRGSSGISIWRFNRTEIPADILSGQPDPAGWPAPKAFWSSATCPAGKIDNAQTLIFDITLCGDWAGVEYTADACPGTCAQTVADPNNFLWAHWVINSLTVYSIPLGS